MATVFSVRIQNLINFHLDGIVYNSLTCEVENQVLKMRVDGERIDVLLREPVETFELDGKTITGFKSEKPKVVKPAAPDTLADDFLAAMKRAEANRWARLEGMRWQQLVALAWKHHVPVFETGATKANVLDALSLIEL